MGKYSPRMYRALGSIPIQQKWVSECFWFSPGWSSFYSKSGLHIKTGKYAMAQWELTFCHAQLFEVIASNTEHTTTTTPKSHKTAWDFGLLLLHVREHRWASSRTWLPLTCLLSLSPLHLLARLSLLIYFHTPHFLAAPTPTLSKLALQSWNHLPEIH